MTTYQWEDVDVPRGAFISFGEQPGQHVTGKVLSYDPQGGTDYNDNICPQLAVELIEPAASINKQGVRTDYPAGELVVLNCSTVSLKRNVQAASLNPGDIIKITLTNLVPVRTKDGKPGTVKEFDIKVARGAGGAAKPQPKPEKAADPWGQQPQSEPPF